MKKLANLKGVKALSNIEQKSINGGAGGCNPCAGKPSGAICYHSCDKSCPGQCFSGVCNPW